MRHPLKTSADAEINISLRSGPRPTCGVLKVKFTSHRGGQGEAKEREEGGWENVQDGNGDIEVQESLSGLLFRPDDFTLAEN